jgi:hypothetical protein
METDEESAQSFDITVDPTPEEKEQERYKVLSPDFGILVNEDFDVRKDYCSTELWSLLESLALPETKRYVTRYVRHCTFAAETWLARIVRYHIVMSKKPPMGSTREEEERERPPSIIPPDFNERIRPLIESIVKKVRHRRWRCSISKKYLDSMCTYTLCPMFSYDEKESPGPTILDDPDDPSCYPTFPGGFGEEPDPIVNLSDGVLRVRVPDRQPGDSFRRVSKEVNISKDHSPESPELVPLLWQLELRLIALLYLDSEWIKDETTVRCFPHLGDSRVLFSVYRKEECDRPILAYNVNQVRNALGRLYSRWNDLAPSRELYYYFCFLRDRVALLSISSLCATIERKFSGSFSSAESTLAGVPAAPAGGLPVRRTPTSRLDIQKEKQSGFQSIPRAIDPVYAFGKYVGNNLKATIEGVTSVPVNELDGSFTKETVITRGTFGKETSGDTLTSEESVYEFSEAELLRMSEKRVTRDEKLARLHRRRLYKRLTRRQKLKELIDKEISQDHSSVFSSIAEAGDYRNKDVESAEVFVGDAHEEPSVVKNALRKLGGDIFSSSDEEDSWDEEEFFNDGGDDGMEHEETNPLGLKLRKRSRKKKKKGEEASTASGSAAGALDAVPTDENFFRNYGSHGERMYSQLGETIKDEDICAEVITHHLIASIKNDAEGGTGNHPKIASDAPALFSDIFLSCLTTDTFLATQPAPGKSGTGGMQKTVKSITHTNEAFIMETHALMSQIEQEIQCWNLMDTLNSFTSEYDEWYGTVSRERVLEGMPWKFSPPLGHGVDIPMDDGLLHLESLSGISGISGIDLEDDPVALLEYAIEFERAKIENVLKMCFSFSRGKRNQFISRNIREESFCHFLNPGEPEFLLLVCGLKNSSIVPSIIVSRLRQNDVDRLAKIIDEKKVYKMIEEFAQFNDLGIGKKNIASQKYAAYLFEYRCCGKHRGSEARLLDTSSVGRARPEHHASSMEIHTLVQQFSSISLNNVLDVHLSQTLGPTMQGGLFNDGEDNDEEFTETETETGTENQYSIFPTRPQLRRMHKHEHRCRFLSPDLSAPWQSPRGLVRVVRAILIRCIHYYMKEISHLIDARSFFFNSWMTVKLCNNPTFVNLYAIREGLLMETIRRAERREEIPKGPDGGPLESTIPSSPPGPEHEEDDGELPEMEEGDGEYGEKRVPTRQEIASLFSSTVSSSSHTPSHSESSGTSEAEESRAEVSEVLDERPRIFSFTPDFTSIMRARAEDRCMQFYFRCPVVLQCMSGSFLWNPGTCTSKECLGADSLLGFHSWLYDMTHHISSELIPELLIQNAFYLESSKSQTWTLPEHGSIGAKKIHIGLLDSVEDYVSLYASAHNIYGESDYEDKGMHYKYLLMLLGNMPSFGNLGMYCTLAQHLCTFVIHMDVMLFPHILETFSIHMEGSPTKGKPNLADDAETAGLDAQASSHTGRRRGARPVDPSIRYVEHEETSQFREVSGEGMDEDFGSVPMYYPRAST